MVANKKEFYRLYNQGRFGNRLQGWSSVNEYNQSDYFGDVSIRCRIPNVKLSLTHVQPTEIPSEMERIARVNKRAESDFVLSESPPDGRLVFQGEVYRGHRGLEMFYSFAKMPMRMALGQQGRRAHGLLPFLLITNHMDGQSQDNLWRLLDEFQGSVVEFSTYEIPVGIEKWNTVFWEVRSY